MAIPFIGACLWTATKGAGLGLITSVGGTFVYTASHKENKLAQGDFKMIVAIGAIAGAALALLSLIFGTLPLLGMAIGAGIFLYLNKDAKKDDESTGRIVAGTIGCALIGLVAGAILGTLIAPVITIA